MLEFHMLYGQRYIGPSNAPGSEYARILTLFWKQLQNNFKFKYTRETLTIIRYVRSMYDLKPEFSF